MISFFRCIGNAILNEVISGTHQVLLYVYIAGKGKRYWQVWSPLMGEGWQVRQESLSHSQGVSTGMVVLSRWNDCNHQNGERPWGRWFHAVSSLIPMADQVIYVRDEGNSHWIAMCTTFHFRSRSKAPGQANNRAPYHLDLDDEKDCRSFFLKEIDEGAMLISGGLRRIDRSADCRIGNGSSQNVVLYKNCWGRGTQRLHST